MTTPFLDEARELAYEDHFVLTRQLERMRESPRDFPAGMRNDFIADNGWFEDKAAFFEAERNHYLELAREMFAENLA